MFFSLNQLSILLCAVTVLMNSTATLAQTQKLQLQNSTDLGGLTPYVRIIIDENDVLQPKDLLKEDLPWKTPTDPLIILGNIKNTHWLRIDLRTSSDTSPDWFLRIYSPNIDLFDIYEVLNNNIQHIQQLGTSLPFHSRPLDHVSFLIPLKFPRKTDVTLLIRIEHKGYLDLPMQLLQPADLVETLNDRTFIMKSYAGIFIVMLIYNFFIFLSTHDTPYLIFTFFIASLGLFFAAVDGSGFQLLWPQFPAFNQLSILLFGQLNALFSSLFAFYFLRLTGQLAIVKKILTVIIITQIIITLTIPFLSTSINFSIASFAILFIYPFLLIIGLVSWRYEDPYAKYFVWAWSLFLLSAVAVSAASAGIISISVSQVWSWFVNSSIIQLLLFSFALGQRINFLVMQDERSRAESEAKSQFIAHVSHELRTPMNAILGISELLEKRLTNKTDRHYNSVIYQAGLALINVINDVLDAAKLNTNKFQLDNIVFNLHELAKNSLSLLEAESEKKPIELVCEIDRNVPQLVLGDPVRIKQILLNFLSNANKFTQRGAITLKLTKSHHDEITLAVSDTGIGMDEATQKILFEAYQQASTSTTREYGGTGLGLFICSRLAALMNGKIDVQSAPGSGTTISLTVRLPATDAEPIVFSKPDTSTAIATFGHNVLVAEDNPTNQLLIIKMLQHFGVKSLVVGNGRDAVAAVKSEPDRFSLVLMDCDMPIMDGLTATRQLREWELEQQRKPLPIVALTAHAFAENEEKCREAGMDQHLSKPLSLAALEQVLANT